MRRSEIEAEKKQISREIVQNDLLADLREELLYCKLITVGFSFAGLLLIGMLCLLGLGVADWSLPLLISLCCLIAIVPVIQAVCIFRRPLRERRAVLEGRFDVVEDVLHEVSRRELHYERGIMTAFRRGEWDDHFRSNVYMFRNHRNFLPNWRKRRYKANDDPMEFLNEQFNYDSVGDVFMVVVLWSDPYTPVRVYNLKYYHWNDEAVSHSV